MHQDHQLPETKLKEIRENFRFFDRDNNAQIDESEFIELLQVISPQTSVEQGEKGFKLVDENRDGHIDFDEFINWWQTCWWEY